MHFFTPPVSRQAPDGSWIPHASAGNPRSTQFPNLPLLCASCVQGTDAESSSGSFGVVTKGVWKSAGGRIYVALKTAHPGSHDPASLDRELGMYNRFAKHPHPNVLNCRGSYLNSDGSVTIVTDYCDCGNLHDFLTQTLTTGLVRDRAAHKHMSTT